MTTPVRPVGYAVVGLGGISQAAVLPAFANARRNSRLAALVSGHAAKRRDLARRYHLPSDATFDYDRYEACLERDDVDAVYIALPNHLHREFAVRAARKGVHVLCEKPLAVTEAECREMIDACRDAGVRLMVAYRLHLDVGNLHVVGRVLAGDIGDPRLFSSSFTLQVDAGNVRLLPAERGGGPLYDLGVYCVNAARYLFRAEPTAAWAVTATRPGARFRETDESMACVLRFPGHRLATFTCSFGAHPGSAFELVGDDGAIRLDNAYDFRGPRTMELRRGGARDTRRFPGTDQFGPQLLYFSDCIRDGRDPEPDGEEGRVDVRIVRALLESAATGRTVALELHRERRPVPGMALGCPAVEAPTTVAPEARAPDAQAPPRDWPAGG